MSSLTKNTYKVFVRLPIPQLKVVDRIAAERYEGNRSMAVRWLLTEALKAHTTEDDHVDAEPADQPTAG